MHIKRLQVLCRICGRDCSNVTPKDPPKPKQEFKEEIFEIFRVDISMDTPNVFGSIVCNPCVRTLRKYRLKKSKCESFTTYLQMTDIFRVHIQENCSICEMRAERAQPNKSGMGKKRIVVTQGEAQKSRGEMLAIQVVNELKKMDSEEKKEFVSILFRKLDAESVTVMAKQPTNQLGKRTKRTSAKVAEAGDNHLSSMTDSELNDVNEDSTLCDASTGIFDYSFNMNHVDTSADDVKQAETDSSNFNHGDSESLNTLLDVHVKQENSNDVKQESMAHKSDYSHDSIVEPPMTNAPSESDVNSLPVDLSSGLCTDSKECSASISPENTMQGNTSVWYISEGDKLITIVPIKMEETM